MPDGGGMTAQCGPAAAGILPGAAMNLSYAVNGRLLVDRASFTLDAGKRTVVLGHNGAGKTVLLRLVHGLIRPTAGEVRWAGRPADDAARRRQAMVFQRPVLLRRSVVANLRFALGLRVRDRAERARREAEALSLAGLEHLARRPARVLSGGEQQRLAVARALALRPEVLFLDEPTTSLDPASMLAIEKLVQAAHDRGVKIVLVTHDLGQARRLADDVLFMHRGRIVERGPADRFFDAPETEAAAAYLDGRIVL